MSVAKIIFQLLLTTALLVAAAAQPQEPPPLVQTNPAIPADTNAYPINEDVSMFYDPLAPYGQWLWIDPYGWVWSPNGVDVGWRPYTDGSWAYADCGWTFVADVPWGWGPYHYGRWFFHEHRGWCWVPDHVWGPAWVSWHFGDAWCGWAPLPPRVAIGATVEWDTLIPSFGWCFVGREDFLRPHLHDHIVVAARNVTLLRETRNVTKIEIRDKRAINSSLSAEQIEHFTGRGVTRLKLADVTSPSDAHRISRGELRMFRPEPRPGMAVRPARPSPEVVARPSAPAASWEELRRNEAQRARVEAAQRAQREALERAHERELREPPGGLSPGELQQRHDAEHRAFNEQMSRERQVFEHRAAPAPAVPRNAAPPARQRNVR